MFNPLAQLSVKECIQHLPAKFSVAELGNQTFGGEGTTKEFYESLGADSYLALDINERMSAIICDLNYPLKDDLKDSAFNLITNNGTSEHLFNQAQVFENIHNLCAINGIILHILPFTPWINHGFYNYNPILFRDLSRVNNYEILFYWVADRFGNRYSFGKFELGELFKDKHPFKLKEITNKIYKPTGYNDVFNVVCLKKINADKFKFPLQGKYVKDVEGDIVSS